MLWRSSLRENGVNPRFLVDSAALKSNSGNDAESKLSANAKFNHEDNFKPVHGENV